MSKRSAASLVVLLTFGLAMLIAADPIALKVQGPDTIAGNPLQVQQIGPSGPLSTQTPVSASNVGAASAITATLTASAGKTTYLTGFTITGSGASAGSIVVATVTGVIGAPLSYDLIIPAGVSGLVVSVNVQFSYPVAATGTNVAIVVNVPSFGAGNTNAAVVATGFQQ